MRKERDGRFVFELVPRAAPSTPLQLQLHSVMAHGYPLDVVAAGVLPDVGEFVGDGSYRRRACQSPATLHHSQPSFGTSNETLICMAVGA